MTTEKTQHKFIRNMPVELWKKYRHEAINQEKNINELIIKIMEMAASKF